MAPMNHRRSSPGVCLLNGKIYAMGGNNGNTTLHTCEVYDPERNQWSLIAKMSRRRSEADACAFDGRIYITGQLT